VVRSRISYSTFRMGKISTSFLWVKSYLYLNLNCQSRATNITRHLPKFKISFAIWLGLQVAVRFRQHSTEQTYRIFRTIRRTWNPLIFSKSESAPYDAVRHDFYFVLFVSSGIDMCDRSNSLACNNRLNSLVCNDRLKILDWVPLLRFNCNKEKKTLLAKPCCWRAKRMNIARWLRFRYSEMLKRDAQKLV